MDKINTGFFKDTFASEQYREYHEFLHAAAHRAFVKCVAPTTVGGKEDPYELREGEQQCVEEYAFLYANYNKKGFLQFKSLYDTFQRDMAMRMMEEQRQMMARQQQQM